MNETELHVEIIGDGPQDVLLLHYFGGSGRYWKTMIGALPADRFRFIIPDLPGFGRSAHYLPDSSVPEKADVLKRLLETHCTGTCLVAGHSMGGKIAMALAAAAPERVSGLALLAPSPPSPEPISPSDREQLRNMYGRKAALREHLALICSSLPDDAATDALVAANCEAAQDAWNGWLDRGSREDIGDRLGNLQLPVRICYGAADTLITGALLEATVCNHFAGAGLVCIGDCGHLLPVEKPDAVAGELAALADEVQHR